MVTRSSGTLRGQRNQCPSCGELFNRTSVFDKHRIGKHGKDRRCMTSEEMIGAGMFKGDDGFWRGKKFEGERRANPNLPRLDLDGYPVGG